MGKEEQELKPEGRSGDSAAGFVAYVSETATLLKFIPLTIEQASALVGPFQMADIVLISLVVIARYLSHRLWK